MPEVSELQEHVLTVIEEHAKGGGLFGLGKGECDLTNQQIFDFIKPASMRPSDDKYISVVLKRLAVKNKISILSKHIVGHRGLKRVITIL